MLNNNLPIKEDFEMRKLNIAVSVTLIIMGLTACAGASTSSPIGTSCDYRSEKPLDDMPLVCQGH